MSDARRRIVRLSIFLLPALLLLAGIHVARADLRDKAKNATNPGIKRYGHSVNMGNLKLADEILAFTRDTIVKLQELNWIYGFKAPEKGLEIDVRKEGGISDCPPGSNRIIIRGITDDARIDDVYRELSRLIARAMLREDAPDADFSPWFEEGVSRYFEGTVPHLGSRKEKLIAAAARNPPRSLADVLNAPKGAYLEAAHAIVAFLHDTYAPGSIVAYASEERRPGPVSPGAFERIFAPDVEKRWLEYLAQKKKGS